MPRPRLLYISGSLVSLEVIPYMEREKEVGGGEYDTKTTLPLVAESRVLSE